MATDLPLDPTPETEFSVDVLHEKIRFLNSEVDAFRQMYKEQRAEKVKADELLLELRNASNNFRLLMFTLRVRPVDCDHAYFFHLKDHWNNLPVEVVMDFLQLFEKHFQLASEIVRERSGRDAIKVYNKAKLEKSMAEMAELRAKPEREKEERRVKRAVAESDKRKRKAIESLMNSLKCDETTARAMLDAAVGKVNL